MFITGMSSTCWDVVYEFMANSRGAELLLVYEFMANSSLDKLLFGASLGTPVASSSPSPSLSMDLGASLGTPTTSSSPFSAPIHSAMNPGRSQPFILWPMPPFRNSRVF